MYVADYVREWPKQHRYKARLPLPDNVQILRCDRGTIMASSETNSCAIQNEAVALDMPQGQSFGSKTTTVWNHIFGLPQ